VLNVIKLFTVVITSLLA